MSEYRARKKDFQYDILELKLFFENGDVIAIDYFLRTGTSSQLTEAKSRISKSDSMTA